MAHENWERRLNALVDADLIPEMQFRTVVDDCPLISADERISKAGAPK
jgi:hypothetical protein